MGQRPSNRSVLVALVVALLGVTAGCIGSVSTDSGTATATATPTPAASTDCPPALTVRELDSEPTDAESAVASANLTVEQQGTFHRAQSGSVEDFAYAWNDIDLVEYEGRYYRAGIVVC
jgi:hypothetical protein